MISRAGRESRVTIGLTSRLSNPMTMPGEEEIAQATGVGDAGDDPCRQEQAQSVEEDARQNVHSEPSVDRRRRLSDRPGTEVLGVDSQSPGERYPRSRPARRRRAVRPKAGATSQSLRSSSSVSWPSAPARVAENEAEEARRRGRQGGEIADVLGHQQAGYQFGHGLGYRW